MLSVNVNNGNLVTLRCAGRIVRGVETSILCAATRCGRRDVILDLTDVDEIDAAGVGAMIALQAAGIYVELKNPSEQVLAMLRAKGAESIFEVHGARAENHGWSWAVLRPSAEVA